MFLIGVCIDATAVCAWTTIQCEVGSCQSALRPHVRRLQGSWVRASANPPQVRTSLRVHCPCASCDSPQLRSINSEEVREGQHSGHFTLRLAMDGELYLRHGADSLNWCLKSGSVSSVKIFPSLQPKDRDVWSQYMPGAKVVGLESYLHQSSVAERVTLLEHEIRGNVDLVSAICWGRGEHCSVSTAAPSCILLCFVCSTYFRQLF